MSALLGLPKTGRKNSFCFSSEPLLKIPILLWAGLFIMKNGVNANGNQLSSDFRSYFPHYYKMLIWWILFQILNMSSFLFLHEHLWVSDTTIFLEDYNLSLFHILVWSAFTAEVQMKTKKFQLCSNVYFPSIVLIE